MATLTMLRNAHLSDTTSINEHDQESQKQKTNGSIKRRLDDENEISDSMSSMSSSNSSSSISSNITINGDAVTNSESSVLDSISPSPSPSPSSSSTSTSSRRKKLVSFAPSPSPSNLSRNSSSSSLSSNSSISSTSSRKGLPTRSQYATVLVLTPLNGTFEKKSLIVPFAPDVLKLGRQTNAKTTPGPDNGYFDSRVLSRQHAEIWTDKLTGKVWIKDAKSSNGTYINKQRLSSDNTESEPYELKKNDILELGIDICGDDGITLVHRKISAKVERVSIMSLQPNIIDNNNNNINSNNNNIKQLNGKALMNGGSIGGEGLSGVNTGGALAPGTINPARVISNQSKNTLPGNVINGTIRNLNGGSNKRRMGMTTGIEINNKSSDPLDVTLFGDMNDSYEDLLLGHTRNSVGGLFMHNGLSSSLAFESTIKKLIQEIHAIKLEGAKLKSVAKVLQEIRSKQDINNQLTSLTIPDEMVAKNAYINELESRLQDQTKLDKLLAEEQSKRKLLEKEIELLQEKAAAAAVTTTATTTTTTASTPSSPNILPPIPTTTNTGISPPSTASLNLKIESLTTELSSTLQQLQSFKTRTRLAEELIEQQSLTIEELKKSVENLQYEKEVQNQLLIQERERLKDQQSAPPSPPISSIVQLHQSPFGTLPPSLQIAIGTSPPATDTATGIAATTTNTIRTITSSRSPSPSSTPRGSPTTGTRIQTTSKPKDTSSSSTKTIPMTTALGVVVLGISLLSFLNRLSRDR